MLKALHDEFGHMGVECTLALARERFFFWPRMAADIREKCLNCEHCMKWKTLAMHTAYLRSMYSSQPLELVCMDFLSLEGEGNQKGNILLGTDHFTQYTQAFATHEQTARTVAKVLWEKYFLVFRLPARIHSDQGQDSESRLL